jgi:Peptidase M15
MPLRLLSIAFSLILLASSGANARDAGILPVTGDASSAARVAALFGTVTSIHRTVERNRLVGGVANSYHLSGRAIDIARKPGVTHDQIAATLRRAGYSLVESLDEGDHSHFAFASATASPAPTNIGTQAAPEAPPKPAQQLLADNHGTLILDLKSGSSVPGINSGR